MRGIIFWAGYFAPALIGWYRKRHGKPIVTTVGSLFLFNFMIGWTVVGWFIVLANAFGKNPVAWAAYHYVKLFGAGGISGNPAGNVPQGNPSSPQASSCPVCHGSGSQTCSSCAGRGSWYDPPTTAEGTAQLRNCTYCTSSGRIRCTSCAGSGRMAAPIF